MKVHAPDYSETPQAKEDKPADVSLFAQIEQALKHRYEFRNNAIKCKPEQFINGTWEPIKKYMLNGFKRELSEVLRRSPATASIMEVIESPAFDLVNPIAEYFNNLPSWNGKDTIKQMADTLTPKTENFEASEIRERLNKHFKKWLVASVACALVPDQINHTCLVLTGAQGIFKTTWLNNLCPQELKNYLYSNHIDLQNKDSQTLLAECFLINIDDQLKQINKKDEHEIKNIITANFVKYRRPYDTHVQEYSRLASFMASVNGNDFLTDPTGSRRFLPFEIEAINIEEAKKIDLRQMYAQALHLFKNGFQHYFTLDEINEMHAYNQTFTYNSIEDQFLTIFFEPIPAENCHRDYLAYSDNYHIPTAVIMAFLQAQTGHNRLIEKRIGESLQRNGFIKTQITRNNQRQWGYWVKLTKNSLTTKAEEILAPLKE
jgi:predicted P-loop ATPase